MITIHPAPPGSKAEIAEVLLLAFGVSNIGNYPAYIIKKGSITVGVFQLKPVQGYSGLVNFAIYPEYQGRGYGTDAITILRKTTNLAIINEPKEHLKRGLYKGIPIIHL